MFRKGNMVEVAHSVHVDVQVGDCGIVESCYKDGYAVRIHGNFASAAEVNVRHKGDRTIFFKFTDLKPVTPQLLDEKLVATLQQLQKQIKQNRARPKRLLARN